MSIIICHNWYQSSIPSGENVVVKKEIDLLKKYNIPHHQLMQYNDHLHRSSYLNKALTFIKMHGTKRKRKALKKILKQIPDAKILHAHNVLPIFTYEIFRAAKELEITTVQTLHNCLLLGNIKGFYQSNKIIDPKQKEHIKKICPYDLGMLEPFYTKAFKKFWSKKYIKYIDKFICLNEFQKKIFIEQGFPPEKLFIKPNFTESKNEIFKGNKEYAIFAGRLSKEKGILEICKSWGKINFPLLVVGSGELENKLPKNKNITYLGNLPNEKVIELIRKSRFLIMNSTHYEPFGIVLVEALAEGVPCLVPNIGNFPNIIINQKTGYIFEQNNEKDLIDKATLLWENASNMQDACYKEYQKKYTPEKNLKILLKIYGL